MCSDPLHREPPQAPGTGLRRDTRGSVAVEFALILPVLALMLYSVLEVGRAAWTHNVLQLSVEEAGRFATANPTATTSEISAVAQSMSSVLSGGTVSYTITNQPGPSPRIRFVTIQATYDHTLLMPTPLDSAGVLPDLLRMTASARMPVIQ